MVTVIGMWEPGFSDYEQIIEYRMWKQSIAAFEIDRWCMVGKGPDRVTSFESFDTLPAALATVDSQKVFLVPEHGQALEDVWRTKDCAYIFGNADTTLLGHVTDDGLVAHIKTPAAVDLFAACVFPMVMTWP